MADVLKGIKADVVWNDAAAELLASYCDGAAAAIDGQAVTRSVWVAKALVDFKGHFAEVFGTNALTAKGDATEVVGRLQDVATGVRAMQEEAHKEQQRRETARAWQAEQERENPGKKVWDWLSSGDQPPVGPPADPLPVAVAAPPATARQPMNPGSGGSGSGGGTSSARSANLTTFATGSAGANQQLAPWPAKLSEAYASFQALCQWGTLDASGVFSGFAAWLAANAEDVRWARVVAAAFTAAGGQGGLSTLPDTSLAAALKANHVDASRQDIVVDPAQIHGTPPTSGYADDPVNTATGNFIELESDLAFPGAAALLSLSRCYNSFTSLGDASAGAFGRGWASVCEAGLRFTDEAAELTLPDGRLVRLPRLGPGWDRAAGESLWLAEGEDSGELLASGNDGSWWRLTSAGTLLSYGVGPESARCFVTVDRDGLGRVLRLTHARGQWIELVRTADRVVAAQSSDGRQVAYDYDDDRLVSVSRPGGGRHYDWNADGLLIRVVDADGVVEVDNRYDARGRVVAQRSPHGRTSQYAYLPGNITAVCDTDGTRANTWLHDDRGRLVGVIDANGGRQSTSYDRWGNPVLITERDGATTVHEYDLRGRRTRTVTPSGADVTYGYDEADRITTVVTEQGAITAYTYDGDGRNPATITDPEGGLTRLDWSAGLLRRVVDPTGVALDFGYDDRGDLVSTTNAVGDTARLERDSLGRVIAAVSPSGQRTVFGWDPAAGTLSSRTDPDGAVWSYAYTAAGRLSATIDPLGARTTVEYGEHGDETKTVDPLGRAMERRLDDLGLLSSVLLPDGSEWRFCYDALSRPTATTDPTGGVWTREFDAAGQPIATLDPTGVRVGIEVERSRGNVSVRDVDSSASSGFDPLGRLTSFAGSDGSASMYVYDLCGRPVEALDGDGGLTRVERDPAGRPVAVTSPMGRVTRYGYDRCGRLSTVTDPAGGVVTVGYDADGRVVSQTLPTGEVARTRYDACGRVVEHAAPGVGTSRWGYDLAGNVVEWSTPQHGTSTYAYDAAGQLTSSTDGNGAVTTYRSDALGRTVEIVNPLGGMTRREFDAMKRCVAETDPLGRTTRAGYDAAGRLSWQEAPDGRRTTWTYDAAGRRTAMAVDGRTVTALTRDLRRRTVRIVDTTDPAAACEHELEWNTRGQMVRRARNGKHVTWSYDADGNRTAMTTPDGHRTRYGYDAAGRLAEVDHTLLGRAAFDRDAAGRIVSAIAGGLIQSWEHRDGFVVAHTITDGQGASRTEIERDEQGRILSVVKGEGIDRSITEYGYDGAHQLTWSRTRAGIGSATGRWVYDAAGRLVSETIENEVASTSTGAGTDPEVTRHAYDLAGQLLSTVEATGRRTDYGYDAAGRRVWSRRSDGVAREYVWNPTGYLAGIVRHDQDRVRKITMRADALGELADVDGTEFFWDTAGFAGAPVLAGDTPVLTAGPVTGIGAGWTAPGWRTARAVGADPWSLTEARPLSGLGAASVGASGEVSVDGLEWMGARVYDPVARGFLSVDPLDPVAGSGWAGNPYAFAGNDPMHALDPAGLSPVTDQQLQAYRDSSGLSGTLNTVKNAAESVVSATGNWFKNNWEYVAGGAMVVAGGVLMATGVGGPAGAMLLSAGADTIIQKATTGEVNWGQVAVSGAAGAVGFGVGGALAKTGLSAGAKELAANVAEGVVSNGGGYLTGPGPHTAGGLLKSSTIGAVTSVGPVKGGAAGDLEAGAGKLLNRTEDCVTGCFVAGTPVLMADGSSKPIEDVRAGDEVLAWNPDTGENEARPVLDSFVHENMPTFNVVIEDGSVITATAEHPFMVAGQGWTPLRELRKGNQLVCPDSSTVLISSVDATGDTATVFNFEVGELHDYYVGSGGGTVLAHNSACRTIIAEDGSAIDKDLISRYISPQKQARHVFDDRLYQGGSYFKSHQDAQGVLDAFHDGGARVLGLKSNGDIVVKMPRATGFNVNPRHQFFDQATDVHFIKGSRSVSVVPTNPNLEL